MTLDEAVKRIKARLKNRTSDTSLDSHVKDELQLSQEYLEMLEPLPWFLLSELANADTTKGDDRLRVPQDFLQEFEGGCLFIRDTDSTSVSDAECLSKREFDELRTEFGSEGRPKYYALVWPYFRLYPIPDKAYTIRMLYWQKAKAISAMSGTEENLWLEHAPNVLLNHAGEALAAHMLGDTQLQKSFQQRFAASYDALWRRHEMMEQANRRYGELPL